MKYCSIACLVTWSIAFANPEHSCTVAGDATLVQIPKLLEVTATDRAIIEWNRFSIGADETVRFLQPSKEAVVLNRVVGQDLSEIFGTLQANGVIFLVNPRGIFVGENGVIDTAAFLASTLDLSNDQFLEGNELRLQGDSEASLTQLGTIRANTGDILLIAHKIENKGLISAPEGSVSLSTGHEILLKPKEWPLVNIRPNLHAMGIENSGTIEALNACLQSDSLSPLAIQQQGDITLVEEGGKLILSSSGGSLYIDESAHLAAPGGKISVKLADQGQDSKPLYLLGKLEGESIQIEAPKFLNAGTLTGEEISVSIRDAFIETAAAKHKGKTISVEAASLFSSGSYEGETIHILGDQITLAAADLSADGAEKGGEILVGGDFQGKNASIRNAEKVVITPTTKIHADGKVQGGKVIVWSDGITENFGDISVKGSSGGLIEVSGKEQLIQRGETHAPGGGLVLFDPQNIVIDDVNGVYPQYQLIDPHLGSGTGFGATVVVLSNGNVVVTKPGDSFAAPTAGAVYLYSGATGALISTITGSTANNQIGSTGVVALTGNGNFVIRSSNWDLSAVVTNVGAVTWGNGTTGVTGVVSPLNSLVGSTASDTVGSGGVIALPNGNYVVSSPVWDRVTGGALANVGAATWGNGTSGTTGTVSVNNSLIGSTANDQVSTATGGGLVSLTNGNYVVRSPNWNRVDGGAVAGVGAATWGNGTTGISGTVSVTNSLIGSTFADQVSNSRVSALTNGNYVVCSANWDRVDGGAASDVGAVTWGNGATGISGTVSVTNSLIGSSSSDFVSVSGLAVLSNGNYVVGSRLWDQVDGGAIGDVGAATWGNGTVATSGTISIVNSLIGSTSGDEVGNTIVALTNGNYVVGSTLWDLVDGGPIANVGAATWGNGTTGTTGTVSVNNSLIGSTLNDAVTNTGIARLTNGNYVVGSNLWDLVDGGPVSNVGAATWGNGTTGTTGTVSVNNSLIGSTFNDSVSAATGIFPLTNGNYVVCSTVWNRVDGGSVAEVGAATWGNGTTGISGTVSVTNSLIGSSIVDNVGSSGVAALSNGNYVVRSHLWDRVDGGAIANVGAATWGNGTTGISGTVSVVNSLIGSTASDNVSFTGVTTLASGNYVVASANWDRVDGGALVNAGADTFGNGTTGITGTVSQRNSVVGGIANSGLVLPLDNAPNSTFVCPFTTEQVVRVGLTSPNQLTYALAAEQTITILPSFITDTLNAGTNVAIFANNDITLTSPLSFSIGNLSMSAGRSVLLNANVTTGGANLTVVANDNSGSVVTANRLAGNATIDVADGVILNGQGGSISLSLLNGGASGDISFGTNSQLITSGSGNLSVFAQINNITFGDGSLFQAQDGSALFIAGTSLLAEGTNPIFQMTGSGQLTLVADNLNPSPPAIGSGVINLPLATFTSNSPIRFYATNPASNSLPSVINGVSYTPGGLANEVYFTYYPNGIASGAFTVFYKGPGGAGPVSNVNFAQIRIDYARAIAESFGIWEARHFGPYLDDDIYPPLWTPKELNLILPSLVNTYERIYQ